MVLRLSFYLVISFCFFTPAQTTEKQIIFDKKEIKVGNKGIKIELATSEQQLARGLMYRKSIGENEGMLFVFPYEKILSFWMKNTYLDLSIGYFDKNKVLFKIMDMEPFKEGQGYGLTTYNSDRPAKYALEVPKGWFQINKIKIGDKLTGI